jgi:AcrR family transcriptional regulator
VSPGLIYHYFANKEAIFSELIKQSMQSDPTLFQSIVQSGDTPSQRLERLITTILKTRYDYIIQFGIAAQAAKEHSGSGNRLEIMQRMLQNLQHRDAEAKDLHELMMRRFQTIRDIIMQLIIEGQREGEFAQDAPSKLTLMIFTCIQSLTSLALNQPEEYEKHYPYTDIIMRMLKP